MPDEGAPAQLQDTTSRGANRIIGGVTSMTRVLFHVVDVSIAVALILSGVAGATFGAMRLAQGHAAWRTRRVLRKARVIPIDQLVDGQLACIVGRVEIDGTPVEALMTRRPCVAFDTLTTTFEKDQLSMSTRVTRRLVPFYVVDATGRVRIDAPEIALCNKPIARSERFEERVIEHGQTIRIVGSVSLDPTLHVATMREKLFRDGATTPRLTGTAKFPLLADVERS